MSNRNSYLENRPKGFFASLGLAYRIAMGGLRLLGRYPVLAVPLLPLSAMVLLSMAALVFINSWFLALSMIFVVAYALMFSFAITSNLLQQIHEGLKPSLIRAFASPQLLRMIPRVLLLSAVWYILVAILVAIETAVHALLDRISNDLADVVINAVLGTVADALRMAGFMMVAIMTFEGVGFSPAAERLRSIVKESPIVAVGGLALTKMASFIIFAGVFLFSGFVGGAGAGFLTGIIAAAVLALGWILSIYLEQIFVTGLYLYDAAPESVLVGMILEKQLGIELPELPPPDLAAQPAVQT